MAWIWGPGRLLRPFCPLAGPRRPPVLDSPDLGIGMGYDGHEPDSASEKWTEGIPI